MEPLGYEILEAGSGEDALAVRKRYGKNIDLVVTDLIMPGMNGQELIELLRKEQPQLRAILMSGYTNDVVSRHEDLQPDVEFVNKPLLPISLANTVRQVLDSQEP